MTEPIYLGITDLLAVTVLQKTPDLIEVRLEPRRDTGKATANKAAYEREYNNMGDALRGAIGPEFCRSVPMQDVRLLKIDRPSHLTSDEFPAAVVDAVQSLAVFTGSDMRDEISERAEYIAHLVDEALGKRGQYHQVRHVISDESLSHSERSEALDMLRIMRSYNQHERE